MLTAHNKDVCSVDICLNSQEKQSCGFSVSGLDCPDWFGKIWVGNVSLNGLGQIYASVLRCCGILRAGQRMQYGLHGHHKNCNWTAFVCFVFAAAFFHCWWCLLIGKTTCSWLRKYSQSSFSVYFVILQSHFHRKLSAVYYKGNKWL